MRPEGGSSGQILGTSTVMVGVVEGLADATARIVKVFSGALSCLRWPDPRGVSGVARPRGWNTGRVSTIGDGGYELHLRRISLSASAYPFGKLSARMSHTKLLGLGLLVLIAADLILATSSHWSVISAGAAPWGLHMGITQGLPASP